MDVNSSVLKGKLMDYTNHKISRDELIDWSYSVLQELLLKRKVLILEYLFTYPFISELSVNKSSWESISDKSIKRFIAILNGEEEYRYTFATRLTYKDADSNVIHEVKKIIDNFIIIGKLNDAEFDYFYELNILNNNKKIVTINDLFIIKLINYLSFLPQEKRNETDMPTIYLEQQIDTTSNLLKCIASMLNACEGKQDVYVDMYYKVGGTSISIAC